MTLRYAGAASASAALCIALSTTAGAQEASVAWEAPPGCPTGEDVERGIAKLREGKAAPRRPVRAHGVVTVESGQRPRLALSLSTSGADTERVIDADSCRELGDAAALLIVLAADGDDAPPAALPASPPRRDAPPPPPAPSAGPEEAAKGPEEERPPFDLDIRVLGVLDVAALPKPAPGFSAGGAIERDIFRGEILATYFPDQTRLVGDTGAGAEVSLLLAAARFCLVPLQRRFELAACLGGETGSLRAVGLGVASPGSGTATWLAPQAAVVGHLHLSAIVSTVASLELAVPVAKERFVLVGVGDVYGAPDVTGRLALGFELGP